MQMQGSTLIVDLHTKQSNNIARNYLVTPLRVILELLGNTFEGHFDCKFIYYGGLNQYVIQHCKELVGTTSVVPDANSRKHSYCKFIYQTEKHYCTELLGTTSESHFDCKFIYNGD